MFSIVVLRTNLYKFDHDWSCFVFAIRLVFFLFSSFFLSFSVKLWECDVYVWDACLPVRKRQSHEREAFKTMIKVATSFSSTFDSEWVEWNINSHRNQCEALHSHQYIMFTVTHTHINSCTCKYGTRFVFFCVFGLCCIWNGVRASCERS